MRLHGYFRSTAAWRVRIALNLKGVPVEHVFRHLRHGGQRAPDYLRLNPQGLVPTLETYDGLVLTQSLAICEWLDETYPTPPLLPAGPTERAHVRAFALVVAADTHPVQNLRVLERLRQLGIPDTEVSGWARWIVGEGLRACETLAAASPGPYCFGTSPTLADLCLVPQLFNARRFACDLSGLPRLLAAEAACMALPAFSEAASERQSDAE